MGWDGREAHHNTNPQFVSILVLMDCGLGHKPSNPFKRFPRCFNPCFDGLWVGTLSETSMGTVPSVSFNPCFDGLWVGTVAPGLHHFISWHVSILVLMDCGLGPEGPVYSPEPNPVSILVLMDCGLGHEPITRVVVAVFCFNPCFDGLWVGTMPFIRNLRIAFLFQSLF